MCLRAPPLLHTGVEDRSQRKCRQMPGLVRIKLSMWPDLPQRGREGFSGRKYTKRPDLMFCFSDISLYISDPSNPPFVALCFFIPSP